jgi:hypothetical protein
MIISAPEIRGSRCHKCGSTLLQLTTGRYCEWCEGDNIMGIDDILEEFDNLSLEGRLAGNKRAIALLDDLEELAYERGYDAGYDFGESNCGEDW